MEGTEQPTKRDFVFIVDDIREVGELVATFLELEGYQTSLYDRPDEALEAFEKAEPRPALLLTDFLMEPINGIQLLERCRALQPNLRSIVYSGNIDESYLSEFKSKPDRFLRKPFQANDLIAMVAAVLETE